MSITDRSTERFETLRERLEEEYGEVAVVEKTWRHPPHFYDDLVERFEADSAGGAGAWVYDDEGRVLLVRESGAPGYGDPGDKRREGESFVETARRAVHDAAGVGVSVTDCLELHRIKVYDGTDPDRPVLVEPIVVFAARHEEGTPEPGEGVDAVEWFTEHPQTTVYEEVGRRSIPYDGD